MLRTYRNLGIRYKLKYFIQVNELYLVDEIKKTVNRDGQVQKMNDVQISIEIEYKVVKNEYGDSVLVVRLLKGGSSIDDRIMDLGNQLQSLFKAKLLEKANTIGFVEYRLLYKEDKENEKCKLSEEVIYNPEGKIRLSKRKSWDYISKPHLLISGNSGSGKSYLLYSIIKKMKKETNKSNIFICDGKFDELQEVSENELGLSMIANNKEQIIEFIETVEEFMEQRFSNKTKDNEAIFLVVDEFAALSLVIEKKEWLEVNKRLKNIILKGRAANIHVLIAMQRASADSIDLAVRDNTAVRIGLGNLSAENFRMVFGQTKKAGEIIKRDRGQGYILIDGEEVSLFEAPYIEK